MQQRSRAGKIGHGAVLRAFWGALLLWSMASTGCVAVDRVVAKAAVGYLEDGAVVFQQEPDPQLAREAIPANFKLLEILLYRNPNDRALLTLAAQYIATYAYAFVEPEIERLELTDPDAAALAKQRAVAFYARGQAYGLRALRQKSGLVEALEQGAPEALTRALSRMGKADVPALFWTAFCWGTKLNLTLDQPASLADSGAVSALMQRVLELDEAYYYGGAHLFFGALLARLPESAGGLPAESQKHFEKALQLSEGKLLMTRVFYARYLAVKMQDRALFTRELEAVLAASVDLFPNERLANLEAQRRARFYLAQADEYFLPLDSPEP